MYKTILIGAVSLVLSGCAVGTVAPLGAPVASASSFAETADPTATTGATVPMPLPRETPRHPRRATRHPAAAARTAPVVAQRAAPVPPAAATAPVAPADAAAVKPPPLAHRDCSARIRLLRAKVSSDARRGRISRLTHARAAADLRRATKFCRLGRIGEAFDALATLHHRYGMK